ncbi:MAG: type II toxin-antitoxin system VapC family toxin [Candidatus Binataceae bacterium]
MILYLDTSAVVKLYASEPGSAEIKRAVARADQIASSLLAYAETRAALARKHRLRQISVAELERSKAEFEFHWSGFFKLPIDAEIVLRAADLAEKLGLGAYDAVHLASADRLHRDTQSAVSFACFDKALSIAASTVGLRVAGC